MAIAGAIKLWLDGRGTTQYEMLADIEFSKWCMSRAMPDIKVILTFKDLATIMIKIAPSLKLSHSCTYDALILVHKTYHNLTGTNIYKSAHHIIQYHLKYRSFLYSPHTQLMMEIVLKYSQKN